MELETICQISAQVAMLLSGSGSKPRSKPAKKKQDAAQAAEPARPAAPKSEKDVAPPTGKPQKDSHKSMARMKGWLKGKR